MKKKLQVKKYSKDSKPNVKKKKPYILKRRSADRMTKVEALDQLLLKMTSKPYNKLLQQIEIGKKKLSDERKLALQIGTRILKKAKEVRDSLMTSSKKSNS